MAGSDKEQTNLIETFEEVGNVPKPVDENSPDMSALIEEIENGLDTCEIIKLHPKYAFRIKEIDTLRQTVLELLCSCYKTSKLNISRTLDTKLKIDL